MKLTAVVRKILSLCLITVLLGIAAVPASAALNEPEIITIGYFSEPGMMNGAEEGAAKSGYAYESMMEIAAHAGWKYTYVYGSFDELYKKFLAGEIDILPFITATEQRRSEMLFPENGLADETFYLASIGGMYVSSDYHELNGKRIGSMDGYFQNEILKEFIEEYDLDCEIVMYRDQNEKWAGIGNGEVDITIESSLTMQSINLDPICRIGDEYPVYAAISKTRPDLLEQFNLSEREIDAENPSFLSSLKVKYFKSIPLFKSISQRGRKWIEEHGVLRVGVFDNDAPLVYVSDDGRVSGVMPDYLKLMFENYGLELELEWKFYGSNDEALEGLRNGEIDAIHPYYPSYNLAESEGVVISTVVYSSPMGLLYVGAYTTKTMNRIATPNTRLGAHYVEENYPLSVIVPCKNGYDCIDKMLAGEADSVVLNATALKKIAGTYSKEFNIKTLHTLCNTCFATLPQNSAIIDIINSTAAFLSDAEVNAIEASYYVESDNIVTIRQFFGQNPAFFAALVTFIIVVIVILIFLCYKRFVDKKQRSILEEARNAADAANRSKTAFLFSMSHDIRTPMNAILGYTDIGLSHAGDVEKATDSFRKIKSAGGHLLNLINDILEMSRIESGKLELAENPVDVRVAIKNIQYMSEAIAGPKGINLTVEIHELSNPYVYADDLHISEVVINLISNAVKYTPEGGKVSFKVEQISSVKDGKVKYRFTVSDTGIGMSEEFQKHLFEAFSREQTSTVSKIQGTGLGLSIVKRIVDMTGGTIQVKSRQNQGSIFTVVIPFKVMDEAAVEQMKASLSVTAEPIRTVSLAGKRVLIVEDNEMNREIAAIMLNDAGILTESVENGALAVKMVEEKGRSYYDFILMDIQMPVMDGYEATAKLRKLPAGEKVAIIALSANAFEEDRKRSLAAGMDAHIAKPIKVDELFDAMQSLTVKNIALNGGILNP